MTSPITIWRQHKTLNAYLNKAGRLLVWTKIYVAPSGFEHQVPYLVGIIQFTDGQKVPLQIVDCEEQDLKPNQKVITVIRRIGKVRGEDVIEYGIKAKPAA